jgi:hypothetical protein
VAARAQAIDDGAARPAAELVDDVQRTAHALAEAAATMPPDAWRHKITWTTGWPDTHGRLDPDDPEPVPGHGQLVALLLFQQPGSLLAGGAILFPGLRHDRQRGW